jgi:hypothetical protein
MTSHLLLTLEMVEGIPGGGFRLGFFILDCYSREQLGGIIGHVIGKTLYLDDFHGHGPWCFGTRGVLQIVRQLKDYCPDAEFISGPRLTGARAATGVVDGRGGMRIPDRLNASIPESTVAPDA